MIKINFTSSLGINFQLDHSGVVLLLSSMLKTKEFAEQPDQFPIKVQVQIASGTDIVDGVLELHGPVADASFCRRSTTFQLALEMEDIEDTIERLHIALEKGFVQPMEWVYAIDLKSKKNYLIHLIYP